MRKAERSKTMTPRTILRILLLLALIPAALQQADAQRAPKPQPPRPAASPKPAVDNLFEAINKDDMEAVHKLLEQNPSLVNALNKDGQTPLYVAIDFFNFKR